LFKVRLGVPLNVVSHKILDGLAAQLGQSLAHGIAALINLDECLPGVLLYLLQVLAGLDAAKGQEPLAARLCAISQHPRPLSLRGYPHAEAGYSTTVPNPVLLTGRPRVSDTSFGKLALIHTHR
jgi:hypothetical protein